VSPAGLPDEARLIHGARFDVEMLLDGLASPAEGGGTELEALWIEHAADVGALLARALGGTPEARRRALETLDARDAGPGLGPLTPIAPSPAASGALAALGERLRDRIAALLDDADPTVRRLALRVASKLRDPRITVSHVQAQLAAATPEGEAAALLAARALLESGRMAGPALIEALRDLLNDAAWERRLATVRVVRLGGAAARPQLQRALADPSPFVRAEAADGLQQQRSSSY
jgi:hypothetical protein